MSTDQVAPVVLAQRLRKGAAHLGALGALGAKRLVADALKTLGSLRSAAATGRVLVRADAAFYGHTALGALYEGGLVEQVEQPRAWRPRRRGWGRGH